MLSLDSIIYERVVNYFSALGNSFGVKAIDVAVLFFSIVMYIFVKALYPDKKKESSK